MSRPSNPVKTRQWAERFERYRNASQTVEQFCQSEGVSPAAFYAWKKKLGVKANSRGRQSVQKNVKPLAKSTRQAKSTAFRPVHVLSPTNAVAVTVRLGDGIVIELGPDPSTVEKVIDRLLEHESGAR